MLSLAVTILQFILGLFGFGKPDPVAQGETMGKAEQQVADAQGELADVKKASDARDAVDPSVAGMLNDPDNAGPASVQSSQGRSLH